MKTHQNWSYSPYRPYCSEDDLAAPYICRVVPGRDFILFEWLGEGKCYKISFRPRGEGDFFVAGETDENSFIISGLSENTEYEFRVSSGEHISRTRLARCGIVAGTVVNYLHPEDSVYGFSGRFLCSPSLLRHPNGYLLASMDVFAANYPQNMTLIFRSDDDGKSWHYISELFPCFWGRMFLYENDVYMLACSTEYGDLLIGKSTDGGKNFSEPTVLLRGGNGKNGEAGVHKNPQPVCIYGGRIWETLEWGSWGRKYHAAMVMSAPIGADLLSAESWSFSEPVRYNPEWKGVPVGESSGNIEGCLVPLHGGLYNIMRYDMIHLNPNYGLVLAFRVDTEHPEAPLVFSHAIHLDGNHSKFEIQYDDDTKRFYSIISRITSPEMTSARNLLSLMVSDDCEHWTLERDIYDRREDDPKQVGFQYVDFIIENKEILFLARVSDNGARNFHDANYSIFNRISISEKE